jgi:hypothetical protein
MAQKQSLPAAYFGQKNSGIAFPKANLSSK